MLFCLLELPGGCGGRQSRGPGRLTGQYLSGSGCLNKKVEHKRMSFQQVPVWGRGEGKGGGGLWIWLRVSLFMFEFLVT